MDKITYSSFKDIMLSLYEFDNIEDDDLEDSMIEWCVLYRNWAKNDGIRNEEINVKEWATEWQFVDNVTDDFYFTMKPKNNG